MSEARDYVAAPARPAVRSKLIGLLLVVGAVCSILTFIITFIHDLPTI